MAYPSTLDELTDGVPSDGAAPTTALGDATYPHDDHHRALGVAVEAVEAELGTDPSGSSATVKARLDDLDTTVAAKVAKSTVTTKGDLLVATASSTPARLGVGTDGQVLTADAASTPGVKWATPSGSSPTLARGSVGVMTYNLPGVMITNPGVSWGPSANRTYYMPVRVEAPLTLTNLYLSVNTAVSGSSVVVGIFAADKTLQPTGSLLFTASVVSTASTGTKTISVSSYAWTAGVYLIALNASHAGLGFDAVNGRVPGVTGGWSSTSWLGTPSIISCSRNYDGTLDTTAWNAASSGTYGINYAVSCGYTVT